MNKTYLFLLTLTSVFALSGCGSKSAPSLPPLPPPPVTPLSVAVANLTLASSTGNIEDRGYVVNYEPSPEVGKPTILTFTSPNGKKIELPPTVEQFLNDHTTNRHVTSFDLPVDANTPSFIYLSTSQPVDKNFTVLENHLYRYDLIKRELTDLYAEKTTDSAMLRTIGRDGSQIILFKDSINNSPGPCSALWYDFRNQIVVFALNFPKVGLLRYQVPQKKITEAFNQEQSCLKGMN